MCRALTNALKHAGDARTTVHVRYRPDSLELEIADDGASISAGGPVGSGAFCFLLPATARCGNRAR